MHFFNIFFNTAPGAIDFLAALVNSDRPKMLCHTGCDYRISSYPAYTKLKTKNDTNL